MQVSEIINKNPIAYSQSVKTNLKPIAYRTNSVVVDKLLEDYEDLIDPKYTKWFAARFYNIQFDKIHQAASEARHDGKDPQKLFAHLIRKFAL